MSSGTARSPVDEERTLARLGDQLSLDWTSFNRLVS